MRKPKPSPALETRPNAHLEERSAAVRRGKGKLLKQKGETAPEVAQAVPPASPPQVRVLMPPAAHPGTYGLRVDDNGLGWHAPPGATVMVEPVAPTKAGLAVFYMEGRATPLIFDLTRNFRPEFAGPFGPGSEVIPLIEVVTPGLGQWGRMRADQIEKMHRVLGIYTPAEVTEKYGPGLTPLPELSECPEGMGEQYVEGSAAYPLIRPDETVVYDPSQREPTDGALCVLQWSGGRRDVLQTNQRSIDRDGEERWFVDPINRPRNTEMMKQQLDRNEPGVTLYASDGPYTEEHLRERIVGTVVGVLVPQQRATPALAAEAQPDPAGSTDPLAHVHPISREEEQVNTAAAAEALAIAISPALRTAIKAHRNAFTASRLDPDDSDANMDRHYAVIDRAADAIDAVPSSTLADLRAKLTYLLPRVLPDVNGRDHVARLLAFRDDLDRLCRVPGMNENGTDPLFEAIRAHLKAHDAFGLTCNPTDKAWREAQGLDTSDEAMAPAWAAWQVAHEAEIATWNAAFETRPTTLPGFVAIIRHAQRWASEHYGIDGCLDADDIMEKIAVDAERVMWAALDKRGDDRPDLSKVPTAELAAMSFEPVNRSASECPVPSRDAWLKDADSVLPWLRMGWLYLSLDRDELADALLAEDDQQADDFGHSLNIAARNFDQLARFARAVLDRRMIGIATLAVREGADDEIGGA